MVVPQPIAKPLLQHERTPDVVGAEGTRIVTPAPDGVVGNRAHPVDSVKGDDVTNTVSAGAILGAVPHPVAETIFDDGGDSCVLGVEGAGRALTDHAAVGARAGDAGPIEAVGGDGIADEKAAATVDTLIPHTIAKTGGAACFAGRQGGGSITDDARCSDDRLIEGAGDTGGAEDGVPGERTGDASPVDAIGRGGKADGEGSAVATGVPHQIAGGGADDCREGDVRAIKRAARAGTKHAAAGSRANNAGPGDAVGGEGETDAADAEGIKAGVPHTVAEACRATAFAGGGGRSSIADEGVAVDLGSVEASTGTATAITGQSKDSTFQSRWATPRLMYPWLSVGNCGRNRCRWNQTTNYPKQYYQAKY